VSLPARAPIGDAFDAHLTAKALGRVRPRLAWIAVPDVDATEGERALRVGHVPQGRARPSFVGAQEVKEDSFSFHLGGHSGQRRPRAVAPGAKT
jgi:hypothetical protein